MPDKLTDNLKRWPVLAVAAITLLAAPALGAGVTLAADEEAFVERTDIAGVIERANVAHDFNRAFARARKLDAAPKHRPRLEAMTLAELEGRLAGLRNRIKAAKPEFDSPESVGVSTATLEAIAACESGGDPTIVSSTGTYRGKYQFSVETWASVGGSGDPAAASEEEQDYRAAVLYSQSGSSPWPVCGH